MSVSPSYRIYVLEQLSPVGPIRARAMFGGVGLYHQGIFFGLIDDDTLYLKVDQSTLPEFERAGSKAFRPYGEDSYSMQYYELPSEVLEDRETLKDWIQKAVAVARRSTTARKKRAGPS